MHVCLHRWHTATRPDFFSYGHCGSVVCLDRSPFFRDVVLTAGGWTWAIWREGEKVSLQPVKNLPSSSLSNCCSCRTDPSCHLVAVVSSIVVEPGHPQDQVGVIYPTQTEQYAPYTPLKQSSMPHIHHSRRILCFIINQCLHPISTDL